MIPLAECVHRGVYRVQSRNLDMAVFDGTTGFIGIREKFGSRFLDTEYHRDTGPPHGTLSPLELIEKLPEGIEVWEAMPGANSHRGTWDSITGREVSFDWERKRRSEESGVGWGWYFLVPEEDDPERKIEATGKSYEPLFEYLDNYTTLATMTDTTLATMTDSELATKLLAAEESGTAAELLNEACGRADVPLDESEQGLSKAGSAIIDTWVAKVTQEGSG